MPREVPLTSLRPRVVLIIRTRSRPLLFARYSAASAAAISRANLDLVDGPLHGRADRGARHPGQGVAGRMGGRGSTGAGFYRRAIIADCWHGTDDQHRIRWHGSSD